MQKEPGLHHDLVAESINQCLSYPDGKQSVCPVPQSLGRKLHSNLIAQDCLKSDLLGRFVCSSNLRECWWKVSRRHHIILEGITCGLPQPSTAATLR